MKLYNSLSRTLEDFAPLEPGHVRMYNCGPTVYNDQHIGNYRTFAFADTLRRWLEYKGLRVTQVINITDVGHLTQEHLDSGEDKVMVKARELGWTAEQVAGHFMERYFQDRRILFFQEPAHWTRATRYVPEMIALVKRLLEKGAAYAVGGNVYFDVARFPGYGKLSGNSLETLKAGARIEINPEKRNPADFALWKTDAKHLMQWDAPWGRGFPGWHIECSAMSMKHLGETFDLHTGGEDNIFPHHECEIAQSEAATGKPFVKVWLHARHLLWDGEKISKSKGNVVLVQQLLDKGYSPAEIRYVLVSTRYRQQVNFSWDLFDGARPALRKLAGFKARLAEAAAKTDGGKAPDLEAVRAEFEARMDDDLDVAGALGVMHGFAGQGNAALEGGLAGKGARETLALLDRFDGVFALLGGGEERPPDEVLRLGGERVAARKAKDWKAADAAREGIQALGWAVEDTKDGIKYRRL